MLWLFLYRGVRGQHRKYTRVTREKTHPRKTRYKVKKCTLFDKAFVQARPGSKNIHTRYLARYGIDITQTRTMDLENLLNLNLSSLMGSQQVSSHTFRRSEGEVWLSLHLEKASQTKEMRGHMNNLGAPGS